MTETWTERPCNELETVANAKDLTGPVEPPRPGIEEPCMLCAGSKTAPVDAPEERDKPWLRKVVGHKPCPSCSRGQG